MKLIDVYLELAPESFRPVLMHEQWHYFTETFWPEIALLYLENEASFDALGIHGASHAFRTAIAAQLLNTIYSDFYHLTYPLPIAMAVVALHDVGRLGHGPDKWEYLSCSACKKLLGHWFKEESPDFLAACDVIISDTAGSKRGLSALLQDADAMEYTRFLSKGEFDPGHLNLCKQISQVDFGLIDEIAAYLMCLQDWERYQIKGA